MIKTGKMRNDRRNLRLHLLHPIKTLDELKN